MNHVLINWAFCRLIKRIADSREELDQVVNRISTLDVETGKMDTMGSTTGTTYCVLEYIFEEQED